MVSQTVMGPSCTCSAHKIAQPAGGVAAAPGAIHKNRQSAVTPQ